MGFDSQGSVRDSSDVDHQQTSNRTHDGDAISPASVETDRATINTDLDAVGLALSADSRAPTGLIEHSGDRVTVGSQAVGATVDGDNSAVSIIALTGFSVEIPTQSAFIIVHGRQQGAADGFLDLITVSVVSSERVQHTDTRGTAPRSYSFAGSELSLAIDKPGETFDVGVMALGGTQQ
jgi:hypothetical protein